MMKLKEQWMFASLLLKFFFLTQLAAQTIVSEVSPLNSSAAQGEQFSIEIEITSLTTSSSDSLIGSFTGSLSWNPSVIGFASHSDIGSGFTGVVNATDAATGLLRFNGANTNGSAGPIRPLTITFFALGSVGNQTDLDLEYSAMAAAGTFNNLLPNLSISDGILIIIAGGDITVNPTALDFGNLFVGQQSSKTVQIQNIASGQLTVSSISISDNTNFSIGSESLPILLSSGSTSDVFVTFSPADALTFSEELAIESNAQQSGLITIPLTGRAFPAIYPGPGSFVTPPDKRLERGSLLEVALLIDPSQVPAPNNLLGSFSGRVQWDPTVLSYRDNSGILSGFTGVINDLNASSGELFSTAEFCAEMGEIRNRIDNRIPIAGV